MRCNFCNCELRDGECPSCELYNAAVIAQQAAAKYIATMRYPNAKDAFLNEYGVMAFVDSICMQVGTAAEAAPFVGLTGAARRVKTFWVPPDPRKKRMRAGTERD